MWILLRLLTAVAVGLFKACNRGFGGDVRMTNGVPWVLRVRRSKNRTTRIALGVALPHRIFFRVSREGGIDRWCKSVGFAREIQTGDERFDRELYLACDHPGLERLLRDDPAVRRALHGLFNPTTTTIHSDGRHLWVKREGEILPTNEELAQLQRVRDGLLPIATERGGAFRDAFFWRALAVESAVWGVACYGAPAILELATLPHPLYFEWSRLLAIGLGFAAVAYAILLAATWLLLRGSSRTHRVFVESAVVLALGVPLSCVEVASDINIAFDKSPSVEITRTIESRYTRTSRGRRGRRRTHYHVVIQSDRESRYRIDRNVQVSSGLYAAAAPGRTIAIRLHAGALGVPWVEQMAVR